MKIKKIFIIDKNRFRELHGITLIIDGTTATSFNSKDEIMIPVNRKNDQRFKVLIEIKSLPDPFDQCPPVRPGKGWKWD